MNELAKGLLPKDVCEVKLVSSLASMTVVFPRIKFPYHNSFMVVDFWINCFCSIMRMFSDVNSRNFKKKSVSFILASIMFDNYIIVQSGAKHTPHLIHFCYSILKLTLRYQEKYSIKFDDHAVV